MEQTMKLGANKTGIDMSPIHSKRMLDAVPASDPDISPEAATPTASASGV